MFKLIKTLFLVCVCLLVFPGCVSVAGTSVPKVMVHNGNPVLDVEGNPVVAYEFKGVSNVFGQASVGNNIKGGPISVPGAGIISGALELVARIGGAILTGVGGVGAAITPDDDG